MGSFDFLTENEIQIKKEYSNITFSKKAGVQNVLIIFDRENDYAKQISKKIEGSIKFDD